MLVSAFRGLVQNLRVILTAQVHFLRAVSLCCVGGHSAEYRPFAVPHMFSAHSGLGSLALHVCRTQWRSLSSRSHAEVIVATTHIRLIRTGQHQNELHARLFNKAACRIYDHFDEAVERKGPSSRAYRLVAPAARPRSVSSSSLWRCVAVEGGASTVNLPSLWGAAMLAWVHEKPVERSSYQR